MAICYVCSSWTLHCYKVTQIYVDVLARVAHTFTEMRAKKIARVRLTNEIESIPNLFLFAFPCLSCVWCTAHFIAALMRALWKRCVQPLASHRIHFDWAKCVNFRLSKPAVNRMRLLRCCHGSSVFYAATMVYRYMNRPRFCCLPANFRSHATHAFRSTVLYKSLIFDQSKICWARSCINLVSINESADRRPFLTMHR